MYIIEQFVQGKQKAPSLCEDGIAITPHFAAVVDGSTSKIPGRHGGREAMQLVCEALQTLSPKADKVEMLQHLTRVLAAHNIPEAQGDAAYRLTCSAVIYCKARRTVWMVGDCQCRFGGTTYTNNKLVDTILTEVRCGVLHHLLAHGGSADELRRRDLGRQFIADALRDQTNFQNDPNPGNPYRYAVLDGTPVDEMLVREIAVPHDVAQLILASDGYPQVGDTLAESEEALHDLLACDPLCIDANAATKGWREGNVSFDDRCYLRFELD